jgi:hypothetical protein
MTGVQPYETVRIKFFNNNYRTVCEAFRGWEQWPAWEQLAGMLAHRAGWHFDVQHDGPLWSLGVLGESRLNIHVTDAGMFHLFDYDKDEAVDVATVEEIEQWLDGREDRAKQPSALLLELASSSEWRVLKHHEFTLLVSWSDGRYAAVLPDHLLDVAFGTTVAEALTAAAVMVCRFFGAPVELAPELTMKAELDASAVRQLASGR